MFAEAGWDRDRILFELHMRLTTPIAELERGAGGIAEGIPIGFGDGELPKFRPDGTHAGVRRRRRRPVLRTDRRLDQRRDRLEARHPPSAILTTRPMA